MLETAVQSKYAIFYNCEWYKKLTNAGFKRRGVENVSIYVDIWVIVDIICARHNLGENEIKPSFHIIIFYVERNKLYSFTFLKGVQHVYVHWHRVHLMCVCLYNAKEAFILFKL